MTNINYLIANAVFMFLKSILLVKTNTQCYIKRTIFLCHSKSLPTNHALNPNVHHTQIQKMAMRSISLST